jgi:thiol-disulfide isomerase/thioredoxin
MWRSAKWWALLGGGAALTVAVAVLVVSGAKAPGNSTFDFPVALYQGHDVLGSSEITFSRLLGDKPIVLNYWASNCPPCAAEMPGFQKVAQRLDGKVQFFGLDVGLYSGFGGPQDSKRELRELGITYPAGPVPDLETIRSLGVLGIPSTDFITPDGTVHRQWVGTLSETKLTELVESLLSAS